jgi:hypothetical protein
MIKLMDLLNEGVYDKGIFKAVFMAGGPGSGKSYVAGQLFGIPEKVNVSVTGLKMVGSDTEFEHFLKKAGYSPKDLAKYEKENPELFQSLVSNDPKSVRSRAKKVTILRQKGYLEGKLGMIIDKTGDNYGKISTQKNDLEKLGYDTYMVFVNTSLEIAQERNKLRDRTLPEKMVEKIWRDVQKNIGGFQTLFKGGFAIVDNSDTLDPDAAAKKFAPYVKQHADKWAKSPIKNKLGKLWVKTQLKLKNAGVKV